ncbi:helix-turn-helix transcriptional regulator [Stackebrandtia nassauensis]|uniref:helix-turn-helix transcriptional regulator n=1 Tax=Stackebrandtia nassauensis TaxID=283811 RepID=UPI0001A393F1|nr:helix-turn-helix transcriptional regulator [Stackebrandtia nassauensis]
MIAVEGRTAARVRAVGGPLRTPARVDLARRILAARVRQGADAFEIADRVHTLLGQLLDAGGVAGPTEGSSASHRRLADAARRLLAARPGIGSLTELAGELGTSRSHLSRVFRRETGESLTRWRTRMRMQAAMDQLAGDGGDLGRLAAGLGFADHAHLTRTTRRELGTTPSRLRTLLGGQARSEHEYSS